MFDVWRAVNVGAAKAGDLKLIERMRSDNRLDVGLVQFHAMASGQFETVQWILENFSSVDMEYKILETLVAQQCTTIELFDKFINMCKHQLTNENLECIFLASIKSDNLELVKYVKNRLRVRCKSIHLSNISNVRSHELLKYLISKCVLRISGRVVMMPVFLSQVLFERNRDILVWMKEMHPDYSFDTSQLIQEALSNELSLDFIKWLVDTFGPLARHKSSVYWHVFWHARLDVFRYLLDCGHEFRSEYICGVLCEGMQKNISSIIEMLSFCRDSNIDLSNASLLEESIEYNLHGITCWLIENGHMPTQHCRILCRFLDTLVKQNDRQSFARIRELYPDAWICETALFDFNTLAFDWASECGFTVDMIKLYKTALLINFACATDYYEKSACEHSDDKRDFFNKDMLIWFFQNRYDAVCHGSKKEDEFWTMVMIYCPFETFKWFFKNFQKFVPIKTALCKLIFSTQDTTSIDVFVVNKRDMLTAWLTKHKHYCLGSPSKYRPHYCMCHFND